MSRAVGTEPAGLAQRPRVPPAGLDAALDEFAVLGQDVELAGVLVEVDADVSMAGLDSFLRSYAANCWSIMSPCQVATSRFIQFLCEPIL